MGDERNMRAERVDGEELKSMNAWDFATAGTYRDRAARVPIKVAFLVVAFVLMAVPFAGMLWARTDATTENRELAPDPELIMEDGSVNVGILADLGAYFEDRFACRNELVTAHSRLRELLGVSSTDQVVGGRNEWLYYGGTLPDYLGQSALTDRALDNIAHNLGIIRGYAESHGARFVFTIAPNKNTLYPGAMPYYYIRSTQPGNAERLKERLAEEGVRYVNLFEALDDERKAQEGNAGDADSVKAKDSASAGESHGDGWYLKRDTHWNNKGALVAAKAIDDALGRDVLELSLEEGLAREDFTGDLESILHPVGARVEANWYYEGYNDAASFSGDLWRYEKGGQTSDAEIVTNSAAPGADGALLMFRDSFGNALVPYFSAEYERAVYSKLVPYNIALLASVDAEAVVIERAERHIPDLATSAPLMPSPVLASKTLPKLPDQVDARGSGTSLRIEKNGPYAVLSGNVDPRLANGDWRIVVEIEGADRPSKIYDAFWVSAIDDRGRSDDFGYQVNMPIGKGGFADMFAGVRVKVYVMSGDAVALASDFSGDELASDDGL